VSGGWNKVRLDPADVAFSKYIRTKAGWKCVRCGHPATGQGLHAAHFHARRKESVRFDEENVDSLCAGCHRYFTHNYNEHRAWKLEQLGQEKYDLLTLRANTRGDKNREFEKIYWRSKLNNEFGIK
jgi:5-methylcytosine-specific restriction endonuclease McrA